MRDQDLPFSLCLIAYLIGSADSQTIESSRYKGKNYKQERERERLFCFSLIVFVFQTLAIMFERKFSFLVCYILTYDDDSRVNAQCADDDAADDGHCVAGSSKGVRQKKDAGADRALQQMHEHGEISATVLSRNNVSATFVFVHRHLGNRS